jgi:hypothetical protein
VDPPGRVLTNEEFAARMAEISAQEGEELDEETAAELRASLADPRSDVMLEDLSPRVPNASNDPPCSVAPVLWRNSFSVSIEPMWTASL